MNVLNNKLKDKKIIVFAAHPDDVEFYVGGTISKLSKINKVYLVLATNGEKGLKDKLKKNIDKCKIRVTEQLKAVKIMGIKFVDFMELKDGEVNMCKKLGKLILEKLNQVKPNIIFSFDPWNEREIHPDHRNLAFCIIDSLIKYNMKYDVLEEIYLFNSHNPNVISDISDFINVKIMANKVHKSQYCEYKKGWRAKKEIIFKINKFYGKFINVEYAEAFRKLSLNAEERHLEDAYESMRTYNI